MGNICLAIYIENKTSIFGIRIAMIFVAFSFVLISFFGCDRVEKKNYYSDKSNYITITATVDNIFLDEENNAVYLWLLPNTPDVYFDNTFKIVGDNVGVFITNGGLELIKIGKTITFTSAPRYFGDGYVMPIVSVIFEDNVMLDFDVGYANLIKWYS